MLETDQHWALCANPNLYTFTFVDAVVQVRVRTHTLLNAWSFVCVDVFTFFFCRTHFEFLLAEKNLDLEFQKKKDYFTFDLANK